jgi:hypothetical protein
MKELIESSAAIFNITLSENKKERIKNHIYKSPSHIFIGIKILTLLIIIFSRLFYLVGFNRIDFLKLIIKKRIPFLSLALKLFSSLIILQYYESKQ